MPPTERETTSASTSDSSDDIVSRIERDLLSRREFLAGLGLGSIGGAGGAVALTRSDTDFQSLATLAGGAASLPDTQFHLPAVDAANSGLIIATNFEFSDGNGELFVNLNGIEIRHDLQRALDEARQTATRLTGRSLGDTATHVSFVSPETGTLTFRGKSWEAGLTVAFIASLRQQSLSSETLITGIVADDGKLLPVGGIKAKARSARAFGATELIVPSDTDSDVTIEGLRVTPVESISDALSHLAQTQRSEQ